MARMGILRVVWVLLTIAAAGAGYVAGVQRGHQTGIARLQLEGAGNLSQRVETLSLLRLGDVSGAIARLEHESDQLARSMALNPGADHRVLAFYKTYLSVAAPSPARAEELSEALEGVPILEPGQCDTALRALLLSSQGGPAEQGR